MLKQLANVDEMRRPEYVECMREINAVAQQGGLDVYTTWSRIWEYPWIWLRLKHLAGKSLNVLDTGTQRSPLAWFLASKGFRVTASDRTAQFWGVWEKANRRTGLPVRRRLLDAQRIDLPPASMDVYVSLSVIEHVPDKARAVEEAARLIKPGGLLAITFDICEPEMGMTFPSWNGWPLTMRDFDGLFRESAWFESGIAEMPWKTQDIQTFLAWHRATKPVHNYVVGGAILKRNDKAWREGASRVFFGNVRRALKTAVSVPVWRVLTTAGKVRRRILTAKG